MSDRWAPACGDCLVELTTPNNGRVDLDGAPNLQVADSGR